MVRLPARRDGGRPRNPLRHRRCAAGAALFLLMLGVASPAAADGTDDAVAAAIRGELLRSVEAWNAGDIRGFMESYWRSDRLRFASGSTVTRGWQATLERYLARYGEDTLSMGHLAFTDLEIEPLGAQAAIVFGRYHLERAGAPSDGLFTLVWRRIDGAWRIVADHSSSASD